VREYAIQRRYLKKKIEWEGWFEKLTDDHALHSGGKKNPVQLWIASSL
jgi:hypothetical protein